MIKIGIASDHAGYEMKEFLVGYLDAMGYEVLDFGTHSPDSVDYADFAHPLAEAIDRDFGSFDAFKEQFTSAAAALFGSGWTWLVKDRDGKLSIRPMPNAGNPLRDGLTPLLTVDVWEHAYYIDYRNRRAEFLKNFWDLIDWKTVEERFAK